MTPRAGQMLLLREAHPPKDTALSSITTQVTVTGEDAATLAGRFIGSLKLSKSVDAKISLDNLRIHEIKVDRELKKILLDDDSVYQAEKNELKPHVIVRTYEANATIEIRRKRALSGEMWKKIRGKAVDAGGKSMDGDTISVKVDGPAAIAFETMAVNYVTSNLNRAAPNSVELREAPAVNTFEHELDISAFGALAQANDARYVLLGNSRYKSREFANISSVDPSIRTVESVLKYAGAQPLLDEQVPYEVSDSMMKEVLARMAKRLSAGRTSLLVVYFIGHAVTSVDGELYLVTRDYDGNLNEDLGSDLMMGRLPIQNDTSVSPIAGSNIGELTELFSALSTKEKAEVDGLYPVSSIVSHLEASGVPFIVLVDACFEHEQMDILRAKLDLTVRGDYYGADAFGGPTGVEVFDRAIQLFGRLPHLNSANVVIFSATPGTIASVVPDPRFPWNGRKTVGPLARRMYSQLEGVVARSETVTWGEFLSPIVDVKPLGERGIHGTVSWSDFEIVNQMEMIQSR